MKTPLASLLLFALTSANARAEELSGAEGLKKCQDNARNLRQHGFCGQGDSACVERLGNELEQNVGNVCEKALEALRPRPATPAPDSQQPSTP